MASETDDLKAMEPEGIVYETWPPRNVGGQHVGMAVGVKATHPFTGITATVSVARSQHRNKRIAADMILTALTHPEIDR